MRRWMRPLIVTVLCLTLSVDTAKACWFLRRCSRGRTGQPACVCRCAWRATVLPCSDWCVPEVDPAPEASVEVIDVDVMSRAPRTAPQTGLQTAPQPTAPPEPRGDGVVVHGPTVITADAREPRGQPQPAPGPAIAVQQPARPAATPADPLLPVPAQTDASAVAQAAAETPMPEPTESAAPAPAPAPATPEPNAPVEPNLFDLYGDEVEMQADEPTAESADDEPSGTSADGADADDAAGETEMADAPEAESAEEEGEATAEDAAEPAGEQAPAVPEAESDADPATITVPGEPLRRWTDATAAHEVRGWLVEIGREHVRILKLNGRHTTVAIDALSAADRDYVAAVGAALAADGAARAAANTTARR